MCNQTEMQRYAQMDPFSNPCLLCFPSHLVFVEERTFSLFKNLILKSDSEIFWTWKWTGAETCVVILMFVQGHLLMAGNPVCLMNLLGFGLHPNRYS